MTMTESTPPRTLGKSWRDAVNAYAADRGISLEGPGLLAGYRNERTIRLSVYMDELQIRKLELAPEPLLPFEVVCRRGADAGQAYVVCELREFLAILRMIGGAQ